MVLQHFQTSQQILCQPLTPEAFAPFGTTLSANEQLSSSTNFSANYGTAVKLHKVSLVENNFSHAPSGQPATANLNIFRCSPPSHLLSTNADDGHVHYTARVLERHPFSSQTFIPMGVNKSNKCAYVVICAHNDERGMPQLSKVEAFLCRGDQAVTYAAG